MPRGESALIVAAAAVAKAMADESSCGTQDDAARSCVYFAAAEPRIIQMRGNLSRRDNRG
jgi:hypothetical protein